MGDEKYRMEIEEDERSSSGMDRREFFKLTGSGVFVLFTLEDISAMAQRGREYPQDFNAYLKIGADGRIACYSGKIEMGQGIITSLTQMLAEELDVDLDAVDMVMGDTDLCPYDRGTFGSRSTKYFGPALRQAAAEAKSVLMDLAAERLNLPRNRLLAQNGVISDRHNPNQQITYSQLAQGKQISRQVAGPVQPEPLQQHTICGQPRLRRDAQQKVTGEAQFAGDIRLPGMLYAKILRSPAHGATLRSVDTSQAEEIADVKIVHDGDLVAVLYTQPDLADLALTKINAQWEVPEETVDNQKIFDYLQKHAPRGQVVTEQGDVDQSKASAKSTIESVYFNHYVAHAPMETHTALVAIGDDKVRVWASTQSPFRARDAVAETLGISAKKVQVITPFVGGGFGGKTRGRQITEAARLAQLTGKPVQVAWNRKEEFFYDTFRPAAVIKASTGLDENDRIVFWDFEILFAGTRSSEPIYDIPHQRVFARGAWRADRKIHPFSVGAWRGPGSNTNVFAMESQTDIMAQAAGMDPLAFRLHNLSDERMKKVLTSAANQFGASFSKAPSGKGYGVACTDYLGTYVATIAEVKVDENSGKVRVERIVCAQDMGEVINPQGAKLQIEGGLTMGLGYCLSEEIRFKGGRVFNKNFDSYEITRFSWLPAIDVVLIDNADVPPQGCGEPAITTTGAVIANAIHDAIGVRLYTLPMTPERIKEAITQMKMR